jgi:3-oxoacyl-[acyl-carrier protein] reductase
MRLQDKVALVTGAGSGFGEAFGRRFVAEGARVAIVDLDGDRARHLASELGDRAIAVEADVASSSAVARAVAATLHAFDTIDIVVNNAGFTHRNRSLLDVDEAEFDRIFDVNVKSIFHMVRAVVPFMRDRGGGVIINVGSVGGIRPRPGLTWYNASKGAVNLLSKSLAVELAPWNIRVNALCPGMGVTGMLRDFMGVEDTPENRSRFLSTIPMGRLAIPDDIAGAAVFLASDDARFVTGIELPVDGGRSI